ncbi:MAG: hypothetical protein J6T00_06770 [Bacteroidaceae bacterium]|nr:hypothetical protein [Bacteroidaceae bacterium]
MKKRINLPLLSIYSLIQKIEEMEKDPATAEQFRNLQHALNDLRETFLPLIDKYKNCDNMPNLDADVEVDAPKQTTKKDYDAQVEWEYRRFELVKAAMQGRVSALDLKYDYRSVMPNIARDSIKMADTLLEEFRKS